MATYAEGTTVSVGRSREEIEDTLKRYGATSFVYGWDETQAKAVVGFRMEGRQIRFLLPLPTMNDEDIRYYFRGGYRYERAVTAQRERYEQATRQRYRALLLVIKAKLEGIESGIETFEQAFMSHVLLPGGQTVSEWMSPQVERAYATGDMPAMLPLLASGG